MNQKIVLVGIMVGLGGVVGCSEAGRDTSPSPSDPVEAEYTRKLTLKLTGEDKTLKLVASGRPGYVARYTNPKRLIDMVVRVKATGAIVSTCHNALGAVVRCGSTPFFTKTVKQADGSTLVKVTDVHGQPCGEEEFSEDEAAEEEAAEAEADDDQSNCGCSGGGSGSGSNGGSAPADSADSDSADSDSANSGYGDSSSTPASGGGVCDEAAIVAKRDAFCKEVNDYLAKHGMTPIDCSVLDTESVGPEDSYDDDAIVPPNATDMGCEDIWEPSFKAVSSWLSDCKSAKTRATNWHEVIRWHLLKKGACDGSPIVLDLDGNGFLASTPERGVRFDLLGRGPVQTAWIEGNDAFLALDRDGNGSIDGARELFGNATRGARFDDGFAALSELDDNNDGRIDARDAAYGELMLWRDANRDGVSSPSELVTLRDAGISALYLSAARVTGDKMFDANSNRIPLLGGFERADGTKGAMADVFLRFKP